MTWHVTLSVYKKQWLSCTFSSRKQNFFFNGVEILIWKCNTKLFSFFYLLHTLWRQCLHFSLTVLDVAFLTWKNSPVYTMWKKDFFGNSFFSFAKQQSSVHVTFYEILPTTLFFWQISKQNQSIFKILWKWQRLRISFLLPPSGYLQWILPDPFENSVGTKTQCLLHDLDSDLKWSLLLSLDLSLTTKPKELSYQDLYYSVKQDEAAVLACNVQSNPPPAFRYNFINYFLLHSFRKINLEDFGSHLLRS